MKPGLSHQRQKSHGFQGYGLSAGVGAGDDQQMKFLSQMDIDGNYPVFVDQRVAALADVDITVRVEQGAGGLLIHGQRGPGKNEIQLREGFQIVLDGLPVLGGQLA